jgi:transcriptional regulator with XRE-family HTH domain
MSDLARRRTLLGGNRSAALPLVWNAMTERGWSDARLAKEMGERTSIVARLLYGDRPANRQQAVKLHALLGIPFEAWDQSTKVTRRKHRPIAPAESGTDVSAPAARAS